MSGEKGERRGHFRGKPRPGRRVAVRYQVAGGDELGAFTKNIGVGGAFIVTSRPAPVGTHVRLVIEMPGAGNAHWVEVRAEVRWVVTTEGAHEIGMGVRFAGLDVDQLLALNEYFASLTSVTDLES